MDHCKQVQVQPLVRKVKKKQSNNNKDEFDRVKQAEKKKRRLEKALATSAAIRAELEKKKLKKLEEQRRLDEEGAAIAEAAALHVLLGEEDTDDSSRFIVPRQSCGSYAVQGNGFMMSNGGNWSPFMRGGWDNNMGISADLIAAAQAVSSLRISENTDGNGFVFNGMFQG